MEIKLKKLFQGYASVRDNIIKRCIAYKEPLIIVYNGDKMLVEYEQLISPEKFQIHKTKFKSKYDERMEYELFDFKFVPNKNLQQKLL